jgi:hypothetical protein
VMRVGQGFDVHRFTDDPARRLVLGGCEFPEERGLAGHSDADVVAHAVADALLGAAGWATSASTSPTPIRGGPAPTHPPAARGAAHAGGGRLGRAQRRLQRRVRSGRSWRRGGPRWRRASPTPRARR